MERYIAFLRGINISGKNKIAMPELKKCFEGLGFCQVVTYLNSGNVVFSADDDNTADIKGRVETMIDKELGLQIPVHIISCDYLQDILLHAPQWWGTDDASKYHNLIFIMSQDTVEDICNAVGKPSQDLEENSGIKHSGKAYNQDCKNCQKACRLCLTYIFICVNILSVKNKCFSTTNTIRILRGLKYAK